VWQRIDRCWAALIALISTYLPHINANGMVEHLLEQDVGVFVQIPAGMD